MVRLACLLIGVAVGYTAYQVGSVPARAGEREWSLCCLKCVVICLQIRKAVCSIVPTVSNYRPQHNYQQRNPEQQKVCLAIPIPD